MDHAPASEVSGSCAAALAIVFISDGIFSRSEQGHLRALVDGTVNGIHGDAETQEPLLADVLKDAGLKGRVLGKTLIAHQKDTPIKTRADFLWELLKEDF